MFGLCDVRTGILQKHLDGWNGGQAKLLLMRTWGNERGPSSILQTGEAPLPPRGNTLPKVTRSLGGSVGDINSNRCGFRPITLFSVGWNFLALCQAHSPTQIGI